MAKGRTWAEMLPGMDMATRFVRANFPKCIKAPVKTQQRTLKHYIIFEAPSLVDILSNAVQISTKTLVLSSCSTLLEYWDHNNGVF